MNKNDLYAKRNFIYYLNPINKEEQLSMFTTYHKYEKLDGNYAHYEKEPVIVESQFHLTFKAGTYLSNLLNYNTDGARKLRDLCKKTMKKLTYTWDDQRENPDREETEYGICVRDKQLITKVRLLLERITYFLGKDLMITHNLAYIAADLLNLVTKHSAIFIHYDRYYYYGTHPQKIEPVCYIGTLVDYLESVITFIEGYDSESVHYEEIELYKDMCEFTFDANKFQGIHLKPKDRFQTHLATIDRVRDDHINNVTVPNISFFRKGKDNSFYSVGSDVYTQISINKNDIHSLESLITELDKGSIHIIRELNLARETINIYPILTMLSELDITINKCKNCGKFFLPTSRTDEKYCVYKQKGGKTCRQLGYENKVKSNEPLKAYRTAYKTQNARKLRHKHIPNIEQRFKNWCITAKNKLTDTESGVIDLATYKEWLKGDWWIKGV